MTAEQLKAAQQEAKHARDSYSRHAQKNRDKKRKAYRLKNNIPQDAPLKQGRRMEITEPAPLQRKFYGNRPK